MRVVAWLGALASAWGGPLYDVETLTIERPRGSTLSAACIDAAAHEVEVRAGWRAAEGVREAARAVLQQGFDQLAFWDLVVLVGVDEVDADRLGECLGPAVRPGLAAIVGRDSFVSLAWEIGGGGDRTAFLSRLAARAGDRRNRVIVLEFGDPTAIAATLQSYDVRPFVTRTLRVAGGHAAKSALLRVLYPFDAPDDPAAILVY